MKTTINKFKVFFIALCLAFCYTISINNKIMANADTNYSYVLENNATYMIKNVYTGLYLDVANAATDNGTQLLQWYDWDTNNQKFVLKLINGKWKIYPLHAEYLNRVLDIPWASADDNVQVALYDEFDSLAQGFQFNYQYGNVYTITTQPSNYTKYLGIQNNSHDLSAFLVQTSNTTSAYWRLIKVGPSVEGITINNGEAYPAPSSHYVLGDCIYVGDGYITAQRVTREESTFTSHYENYNKYYYRIFRYQKALSAPVHTFNSFTVQPGQSISYTSQSKIEYSETASVTNTIGVSYAVSTGAAVGVNYGNLYFETSCESTISTYFETSYSLSRTLNVEISEGSTLYAGTNITDEPIMCNVEARSLYNCYVVQLYNINYTETTESGGWGLWAYTMHYYADNGTKTGVREQCFTNPIDSQLSICITPYEYDSNSGTMLYAGAQATNVVYV